jgi:hypothetical protein
MSRQRGRPPRNDGLNLSLTSTDNYNNNSKNIWPISTVEDGAVKFSENDDRNYIACFKSDKPEVFLTLFEAFKGRYDYIAMIFSKSGVEIKHLNGDIRNDMVKAIAKIFPEHLQKYLLKKETTIKTRINDIFKIFKSIPKKTEFWLAIKEIKNYKNLEIIYKYKGHVKKMATVLRPVLCENKFICNYPDSYNVIAILNSDLFARSCKDMQAFNTTCEISYQHDSVKGPEIIFTSEEDTRVKCEIFLSPLSDSNGKVNKHFNFIKYSTNSITGKYNIMSFNKYTKCSKISQIVKLYLSNINPLIIEYDVGKTGTLQLFVQSQLV